MKKKKKPAKETIKEQRGSMLEMGFCDQYLYVDGSIINMGLVQSVHSFDDPEEGICFVEFSFSGPQSANHLVRFDTKAEGETFIKHVFCAFAQNKEKSDTTA